MTRRRAFLLLLLYGLVVAIWLYRNAVADPIVRTAEVGLADWPRGQPPLRILLVSDLHVAGPDMPPTRLAGIVWQIEALSPDLVLIAGDFVSDRRVATHHYTTAQAIEPLARLHPRLGVYAVLGNHDHWRDAAELRRALEAVDVHLLANSAARVGPLALGGVDDAFTGHDDVAETLRAMARVRGARIILGHSPDDFPQVPARVGLMLAGHTHCGQIRLPLIGAISTMSDYGERYARGLVREDGKTLIVTCGVGTSLLPLRLGAPPDMWLVTVGPRG